MGLDVPNCSATYQGAMKHELFDLEFEYLLRHTLGLEIITLGMQSSIDIFALKPANN